MRTLLAGKGVENTPRQNALTSVLSLKKSYAEITDTVCSLSGGGSLRSVRSNHSLPAQHTHIPL